MWYGVSCATWKHKESSLIMIIPRYETNDIGHRDVIDMVTLKPICFSRTPLHPYNASHKIIGDLCE